MLIIKKVENEIEVEATRNLIRKYAAELQVDLCFQDFENELATLPGEYSEPTGSMLLGYVEGKAVGCVGLRYLKSGICEMKRMYLEPAYRQNGHGRQLAVAILQEASRLGYNKMRLDTLPKLTQALKLYTKLGFYPIAPYYKTPLSETIFMEINVL